MICLNLGYQNFNNLNGKSLKNRRKNTAEKSDRIFCNYFTTVLEDVMSKLGSYFSIFEQLQDLSPKIKSN
jgi:hypothetical protein